MPIRNTMRRSRGTLGLMCGDLLLNAIAKVSGVDDRTEFGNRAIAHQFDDAAVMLGQQRVDDHAP